MRAWVQRLIQKLPPLWRILGALFSGFMLYASYQPTGLWWAGPLGFALLFAVLTAEHAVLLAFLFSLSNYLFMLPWIGEFVGAEAWIALAIAQALYSLIFGFGVRFLLRWKKDRWDATSVLLAAAFFVAVEYFRSSWPFGGFGWGRVAWGQVGGPLAADIRLGGAAFLSFIVILLGGCIFLALQGPWDWPKNFSRSPRPRRGKSSAHRRVPRVQRIQAGAAVLAILLGSAGYGFVQSRGTGGAEEEQINVAAIQGNVPRAGLDFAAQRRAVLSNHVQRTHELADSIRTGEREQPDVVIWPENASDVNPLNDEEAAAAITAAADAVGVPIMVGTVIGNENTMLVWNPSHHEQPGPGEKHVKRFLQPFGEYMPFRDVLKHVNENVERAGNFVPGDGDGMVTMDGARGKVRVGVSTCYEISFDASARDAVRAGAEFLASPTNNATFGFTDMSYQQLAMSRMRAIETDRAVVVAATSGVSAIALPDGEVVEQSRLFTPDILQANIPLREGITPSVAAGPWVERGIAAVGVVGVFWAIWATRSPRKKQKR